MGSPAVTEQEAVPQEGQSIIIILMTHVTQQCHLLCVPKLMSRVLIVKLIEKHFD